MSRRQGAAQASDDPLDREIRAFESVRSELEADHRHKWVVLSDGELWGTFDTFQTAALTAREALGDKVVLIRQVGAPTAISLPSSLLAERPHVP